MQLLLAKFVKCVNQTVSPAKMGLFRMSREFQFGVCKHEKPRKVPSKNGGEKEVGRAVLNRVHSFSLAELLPKNRPSFFFLGSVMIAECKSSPFWSSDST